MAAQQQPSEEDILAFLRGQDVPLSGKLVGQRMGFQGRRNVNAQLHSLLRQKLVRKDEKKNPPEWSAVGGAADRGTPPPQPSRVSALAQDFEGIDLSGDSSDPPSTAASSTQSINTPVVESSAPHGGTLVLPAGIPKRPPVTEATPPEHLLARTTPAREETNDTDDPFRNWTEVKRIGRGSCGDVFLYQNTVTQEQQAVKMVYLDPNDEEGLQSLESEIKLFKGLHHPRIVKYYDAMRKEDTICIFMEYMPGGSIQQLMKTRPLRRLTEELTWKFTGQTLEGVAYLHGCNIIHMDIKGANILIDSDDNIKLADFDLSKQLHSTSSGSSIKSARGTFKWMAIEVLLETSKPTVKADIWSIGCTVVEMLTGYPPLHDHSSPSLIQVMKDNPEMVHPHFSPPLWSKHVDVFLSECFKVDPKDRKSADELLDLYFSEE